MAVLMLTCQILSRRVATTKCIKLAVLRNANDFQKNIVEFFPAFRSELSWKRMVSSDGQSSSDKTEEQKHVTVVDSQDKLYGVMSLRQAEKLAKTKNLKLVQIEDPQKRHKIVYKLMTGAQLHEERLKDRVTKRDADEKKVNKTVTISAKISSHDLDVKIKMINKWLQNGHLVKVTVTTAAPNSETQQEKVAETITKNAEGRLQHKRLTNEVLKFNLLPVKAEVAAEVPVPVDS